MAYGCLPRPASDPSGAGCTPSAPRATPGPPRLGLTRRAPASSAPPSAPRIRSPLVWGLQVSHPCGNKRIEATVHRCPAPQQRSPGLSPLLASVSPASVRPSAFARCPHRMQQPHSPCRSMTRRAMAPGKPRHVARVRTTHGASRPSYESSLHSSNAASLGSRGPSFLKLLAPPSAPGPLRAPQAHRPGDSTRTPLPQRLFFGRVARCHRAPATRWTQALMRFHRSARAPFQPAWGLCSTLSGRLCPQMLAVPRTTILRALWTAIAAAKTSPRRAIWTRQLTGHPHHHISSPSKATPSGLTQLHFDSRVSVCASGRNPVCPRTSAACIHTQMHACMPHERNNTRCCTTPLLRHNRARDVVSSSGKAALQSEP